MEQRMNTLRPWKPVFNPGPLMQNDGEPNINPIEPLRAVPCRSPWEEVWTLSFRAKKESLPPNSFPHWTSKWFGSPPRDAHSMRGTWEKRTKLVLASVPNNSLRGGLHIPIYLYSRGAPCGLRGEEERDCKYLKF